MLWFDIRFDIPDSQSNYLPSVGCRCHEAYWQQLREYLLVRYYPIPKQIMLRLQHPKPFCCDQSRL